MPVGIEQYGCFFQGLDFGLSDVPDGFFSNVMVQFFALVVEIIDIAGNSVSREFFVGRQQFHGFPSGFNPSRRIDAGAYAENNIVNADFFVNAGHFDNGFQSQAGIGVELLQTVIGQNPVFTCNGYDVTGNADTEQVQQLVQFGHGQIVLQTMGLHQFETYSTPAQPFVGIRTVAPLRVQYCHCFREIVSGCMVVANDNVYFLRTGIFYFFYRFDSAISDQH